MTIETFAKNNRLKIRRDECNDPIIPGKHGQVYHHEGNIIGVMYMPDPKALKPYHHPAKWTFQKQKLIEAGCTIVMDCDGEGAALFDAHVDRQVNAALRTAGVKKRRVPSDALLARLASMRAAINSKVPL